LKSEHTPNPDAERTAPQAYWRDPVIWVIVAAAVLVRVLYNLALHPGGDTFSPFIIDEREYFGAAYMLAEGRGFTFFDTAMWVRPPLYVALLGLTFELAGSSYLPVLLLQSLLSAATLLPLGWLAYRVKGTMAARWAMLIGLLYMPFTLFAGLLLSETLFIFLFSWAMLFLVVSGQWSVVSNEGSRVRGQHPAHVSRFTFHVSRLAGHRSLVTDHWPLVLAGLLLGLGGLTRSTVLGFVPLAALWLVWGMRKQPLVRRVVAGGVLLGVCLLCLVPWTVRNYAAYGKLVLVDTTGGYNLWLASVGVRDEERLQADLRAIPNPAERQDYAYARGIENIAADPLGFAGKGLKESLDLWRPLFSAEERQIRGYALGRVPAWHLGALFIFDDLLYVAILLLALLGFALTPAHPLKSLTGLWVLLWVLIAFIFFAVTRFRLPIVALLVPWAGVGAAMLVSRESFIARLRAVSRLGKPALLAGIVAIGVVVLPALPVGDTLLGVERWGQQEPFRQGEALLRDNKPQEAIAQYKQANQGLIDTRYSLAAAYLQIGQTQEALTLLTGNEPPDRYEPSIIRGEAARIAGDLTSARSLFNARPVQVAGDEALVWAWDHLRPPVTNTLDIGSGLDVGYIRGFYAPETDAAGVSFRWTGIDARIRGFCGAGNSIEWSGWRPNGQAKVTARCLDGAPVEFTLANSQDWETTSIELASDVDRRQTELGLYFHTDGFIGAGSDPRLLGVRVSSIGSDR
jgi:4-amino-4-deoxy-L-arabinose transferase-like glycosyltransferase